MRKKILNLALILMLISAMFILTGCGEEENNADDVENIEEEISINEEKIELNPELEGVCAFAVKVKDEEIFHGGIGESKIIALLDDGTEVDITDYTTTDYRGFDYDNGKLYFNNESNFYEIDLTQGNGVYEVEDLCTIESASSLTNKILIYNEKIYFKNSDRQLAVYDMSTNELDIISENDEEIALFT